MGESGQENLIASDGTTAKAGIGDTSTMGGNTWTYTKATAAVTAYQLCQIDDSGFCAPATTTTAASTVKGVGPAQFAVASGEYFWLPTGPFNLKWDYTTFKVLAAASCVKDVPLYTTATDGVVDDTSAGSTVLIAGLTTTTTVTGAASVGCKAVGALRLTT